MVIFKSLEIGTSTTQSIMNSLERHGISILFNLQYFHQELPDDLIFEASPRADDIPSSTYNDDPNTHIGHNKNDQGIHNNKNDQDNINFKEYIAQPTKAWPQAYNLFRSNEDANTSLKYENLLTAYKNLMNTSASTSVKQLPKGISTFKRAFEHLKAIFIPRLV